MQNPGLVDEVIAKTDIVAVLAEYLTLIPAGKNYKALCPFHSEKTPSFVISPEKKLWHCFGCGTGGNVLTFLMKQENLEFSEAFKILAEKQGLEISPGPEPGETRNYKARLHEIIKTAAAYYHAVLLRTDEALGARQYLQERGLSPETLATFKLGYAPLGYNHLFRFLVKKGYVQDDILQCGLITVKGGSGEPQDYFFNRVIFPITDQRGRIIAMGGRTLTREEPKYLNSPETKLFSKAKVLYGLSLAKGEISRTQEAIVVEGYMDAIALYQAGIKNAVASMGTALSVDQALLLKKYTTSVYLAYDADTAGETAALRAIPIFEQSGLSAKVMVLPAGVDPDALLQKHGKAGFEKLQRAALEIVNYYLLSLHRKYNVDLVEERSAFIAETAKFLASLKDQFLRDIYLKQVVESFQISEKHLRQALAEVNLALSRGNQDFKFPQEKYNAFERLLAYLIMRPGLMGDLQLAPADFPAPEYQKAAEAIAAHKTSNSARLLELVPVSLQDKLRGLILSQTSLEDNLEQLAGELAKKIRDLHLEKRLETLSQEIKKLLAEGKVSPDDEKFLEYQKLYKYFKGASS